MVSATNLCPSIPKGYRFRNVPLWHKNATYQGDEGESSVWFSLSIPYLSINPIRGYIPLSKSVFSNNPKGDFPYYLKLQTREECWFPATSTVAVQEPSTCGSALTLAKVGESTARGIFYQVRLFAGEWVYISINGSWQLEVYFWQLKMPQKCRMFLWLVKFLTNERTEV